MKILVTNDDSLYAPGLWAAVEALEGLAEVVVVAPDREQSGVGGSVTLNNPIRAKQVVSAVQGVPTWAVEGTPADSVIIALECITTDVDLVVSGINSGANLGEDVLISGTVGAALQGYSRGIPSVAVSVASLRPVGFEAAAKLVRAFAVMVREGQLPTEVLLNINVPPVPVDQVQGIEATRLARRTYADTVRHGDDGKNGYYWITRTRPAWQMEEGTDVWAVRHRRISITPLNTDITAVGAVIALQPLAQQLVASLGLLPSNGQVPSELPPMVVAESYQGPRPE